MTGTRRAARGLGRLAVALVPAALAAATARAQAPPCAGCVVWEARPDQAQELLAQPGPRDGLAILVRPAPTTSSEDLARLLQALRDRGVGPGAVVAPDAEPASLAAAQTVLVAVEPGPGTADVPAVAFRLKSLATALRAAAAGVRIGLEADAGTRSALLSQDLAAYLDFVVEPSGHATAAVPLPPGLETWRRWRGEPPTAESLLAPSPAAEAPRLIVPWPADTSAVLAQRALRDVLPAGLAPLPAVTVRCEDAAGRLGPCPGSAYLHPATLDAVVVVDRSVPVRAIVVSPAASRAVLLLPRTPDAVTSLAPRATRDGARVDLGAEIDGPFVLRVEGWSGDQRLRTGVDVEGVPDLTVAEVIARHQAAVAWQARAVPRFIASGRTLVTFQVPALAAPMAISAETVLYEGDGVRELEQRSLRLGGTAVRLDGTSVPRLPLLEPERASALPLVLTLDQAYTYRLEGRARLRERDCYVVAFSPSAGGRALLRGRAFIEARSFGLARFEAVQTGLRGPIVSSEETADFVALALDGRTAWLPERAEAHQLYEGPGYRTALARLLVFDHHELNPADYDARRRQAHAGSAALLRDGPEGWRYLPRGKGEGLRAAERGRRSTRVFTLAAGALVDPNIDGALPFGGVSYVDFDVLGSGVQASAFFAGAFAQLAWSTPAWGRGRWQLTGAAFAALASYNDRVFHDGVEQYRENLRQRPAYAYVAVIRPLGARLRARASYELEHIDLERSDLTAPEFVEPLSHTAHGLRLALEAERGAWHASVWGSVFRRPDWRPWGFEAPPDAPHAPDDYSRFGLVVGRTLVPRPSLVARVEAEARGGRGLDRFSRFNFDGLEPRLRGYPSAALRYDHGAVLRSSGTWSIPPGLRLSAFLDGAAVRDPGFGQKLRPYVGVGAALEAPLPWGFLFTGEWGYGFQGRDREGQRGTHVARVTVYRVL